MQTYIFCGHKNNNIHAPTTGHFHQSVVNLHYSIKTFCIKKYPNSYNSMIKKGDE